MTIGKLRILGLDRLNALFTNVSDPNLVKEGVRDAGKIALKELRQQPPPRRLNAFTGAPPRHVRTGNLGKGWKQELARITDGWAVYIRNTVSYVAYVQIAETQAWFHRGVWGTDIDAAKKAEETTGSIFNDAISKVINKG